jgi:hypothetical protein
MERIFSSALLFAVEPRWIFRDLLVSFLIVIFVIKTSSWFMYINKQKPCQIGQVFETFIRGKRRLIIPYIAMNYDKTTRSRPDAGFDPGLHPKDAGPLFGPKKPTSPD